MMAAEGESGRSTVHDRRPIVGPTLGRLTQLTDGVFSIVMTLLVFNLQLPAEKDLSDGLAPALFRLWPSFVSFVISFAVAGVYWAGHASMFRWVRRASHELYWLNLLLLALVSLIPFTASLLARHYVEFVATAAYGANLSLIGLVLYALWRTSLVTNCMGGHVVPRNTVRFATSRILAGAVLYSAAVPLALVSPGASLVVFAAVPLLYILPPVQRAWMALYGVEPSERADDGPAVPEGLGAGRDEP